MSDVVHSYVAAQEGVIQATIRVFFQCTHAAPLSVDLQEQTLNHKEESGQNGYSRMQF